MKISTIVITLVLFFSTVTAFYLGSHDWEFSSFFKDSSRMPTSVSTEKIDEVLLEIYEGVQIGVSSTDECHLKLSSLYHRLLNMSVIDSGALELTKEDYKNLVETSFLARLEMKEKLKQLRLNTEVDQQCLASVKDVFRAMRYVEDYLLELVYPMAELADFSTFETMGAHFQVNPKFQDDFKSFKDLKSGDVILSRGGAYSSAAIARVGLHDTQFSHLILVYVDPKTKIVKTVEAHIEVGSLILELEEVLDERHARAMLFRYPDEVLAHKAAEVMYHKVHQAEKSGNRIPYDFGMDYKNHDEIFCTEIIYMGYKKASGDLLEFPEHKTQFNPGLINFLKILGINVDKESVKTFKTFAPGDIQFDPNFEVVAEYRHPAKLRDSREKDVILTKLFEWMIKDQYMFTPTFDIRTKSTAAYLARRTPILKKKLEEKFPLNMPKDLLRMFMTLDEVGEILHKRIHAQQEESEHPLTPKELFDLLDLYKVADAQRFNRTQEIEKELSRHLSFGHRVSHLDSRVRKLKKEKELMRPHFHHLFRN